MKRGEVLHYLKKLGLTDNEAIAYVCLIGGGPSDADNLAKVVGMPSSEIYDTLKPWTERLVKIQGGTSNRFKALPPASALVNLCSRICAKRADLKRALVEGA